MQVHTLLDAVSATGAGTAVEVPATPSHAGVYSYLPVPYCIVQARITGTATVQIRGRTSTNMNWEVLDTLTADGGSRCTLFPLMDANVSSYGSGTVTVELAC